MRRIRLHVDLPLAKGATLDLPMAAAEHAIRVLRLREGDAVTLFNGDGHDYQGHLDTCNRTRARVFLESVAAVDRESSLPLVLAQAIARGEKMDWVVQKATELGVTGIVPLNSERSEVRLDARRADKRHKHWQAVAVSACEQSGRARVPWIDPSPSTSGAILAIGPEGGWGDRDLAALHAAKFTGLNLGPRVLRTETAGPAALAALQALHGDL
jgi:16S rRNA (uracil1498-N3)-methyltransferase